MSGKPQAMRFLSLSQPWLWAITDGPKRVENRTWAPPIDQIGRRFALHAAKSWDDAGISMFVKLGIEHPMRRELYDASAIVGVATIDRVVTEARTLQPRQVPWFFGPFGWILTDVVKLESPIPMKGAQGLRSLPDDVAAMIAVQLKDRT